jgi:hypothetical protein
MVSDEEQLERMLRRVLAPVEPRPQFVTRLRGRLVHVQGSGGASVWTLVAVGVGLVLMAAAWMGLALRLILALVGILGLIGRRLSTRASPRAAS